MIQVLLELLQQKKRMFIAAAVLLALNGIVYGLLAGYLVPKSAESLSQWNNARTRVAEAGKIDVATVYRRGNDDLKRLLERIPAKREFPRVLGEILDAAAANSTSTGAVSYKPQPVKDRNLLAYGISLSVSGSYAAIKSFLDDLQKFDSLVVVDSISFTKSDLYEENVVMDVKLTVYLQGKEGA